MYIPKHFEQPRIDVMQTLIRDYPLATLVTWSADGLNANHIPLHLTADDSSRLMAVCAVMLPVPIRCGATSKQTEILAIFQAENAYISPSWYTSKQETGKVVPTWNYAAVHAYGHLKVIEDSVWIRSQLDAMTAEHEANLAALGTVRRTA